MAATSQWYPDQSPAQRVLYNLDTLQIIFSQFQPPPCGLFFTSSTLQLNRQELLHLALVCRLFCPLALDLLWRCMPSLEPLLCIPRPGESDLEHRLASSSWIERWTSWDAYSRRIQELEFSPQDASSVTDLVGTATPQSLKLLPNLRILNVLGPWAVSLLPDNPTMELSRPASNYDVYSQPLLRPSLRAVRFDGIMDEIDTRWLQDLSSRCLLSSLTLMGKCSAKGLNYVAQMATLRTLDLMSISDFDPGPLILGRLASIPHLERLSLSTSRLNLIDLQPGFAALTRLDVSHSQDLPSILRKITSTRLSAVRSCSSSHTNISTSMESISCRWPDTMEEIVISGKRRGKRSNDVANLSGTPYLSQMTNLSHLEISSNSLFVACDTSFKAFALALPRIKTLALEFGDNKMSEIDSLRMATILVEHCPLLTTLSFPVKIDCYSSKALELDMYPRTSNPHFKKLAILKHGFYWSDEDVGIRAAQIFYHMFPFLTVVSGYDPAWRTCGAALKELRKAKK